MHAGAVSLKHDGTVKMASHCLQLSRLCLTDGTRRRDAEEKKEKIERRDWCKIETNDDLQYMPSFSDPSVMCSKDRKTDLFHCPVKGRRTICKVLSACPVCLSRLSDTDGTVRLAIFTVPSVPSCFSETPRWHAGWAGRRAL